jgi:hypothetical protein
MTQKVYDPGDKHPPGYQADMNPDAAAGINYGSVGLHPERDNPRTAYDVKEAHRLLQGYSDDHLKQIPILPAGSRLEQDATYIDLADPDRKEFKATSGMEAGPEQWIVPKREVDYQLRNRLRGVTDPARTGAVQGT